MSNKSPGEGNITNKAIKYINMFLQKRTCQTTIKRKSATGFGVFTPHQAEASLKWSGNLRNLYVY